MITGENRPNDRDSKPKRTSDADFGTSFRICKFFTEASKIFFFNFLQQGNLKILKQCAHVQEILV